MTKIAGSGSESGSISQRHGSADPDPNKCHGSVTLASIYKDDGLTQTDFISRIVVTYQRRNKNVDLSITNENRYRYLHT
jgi:hypothetical protein